ncbi:MAG: aminomethyl-transferring glycine dehydrogenase subunit GcvPB, partial [Nitrososphaerota archaeon]
MIHLYRQARWDEKLVYEISEPGVTGYTLPNLDEAVSAAGERMRGKIPAGLVRGELELPQLSEQQVLRHYTRLSQMNFSISTGFYPLGSCTMKYNPPINNLIAGLEEISETHPLQPEETV